MIDPSEFKPIEKYLNKCKDVKIGYIFCTHGHWDHIGGAEELI